VKFGIDKRRSFYSTMIMSGQMTRDEAMEGLQKEAYPAAQLRQDRRFVLKKLRFTEAEFESWMRSPRIDHLAYRSMTALQGRWRPAASLARALLSPLRRRH
jgi:hypothetical protein